MQYTVRLESGEEAVELTEDSGNFISLDRDRLEERAMVGLKRMLREIESPFPEEWAPTGAYIVVKCNCGSDSADIGDHERICQYRVCRAIVDGNADQI